MYKILGGDGKEYGPVSAEQIRQWIRENRLNGHSMAKGADATDWRPLSAFAEFSADLAALPPPIPAAAPSAPTPISAPRTPVPSYLVPAILTTLFCCLPFGIPAIVYAAQVSSKQAAGDIAAAQIASKNAHTWCWVAFGVGVIWNIVAGIVAGAFFAKVGGQFHGF